MKLAYYLFFTLVFFTKTTQSQNCLSIKTYDKPLDGGFKIWQYVRVDHADTNYYHALASQNETLNLKGNGKFTLTFFSVFGHQLKRELIVGKKKKYSLKIKQLKSFYNKISNKQCLAEKLQIGDTLFLLCLKSGNEISFEKIGITRIRENQFKAMLYKGFTDEEFMDYTVNEVTYKSVIHVEKSIKQQQEGNCKLHSYCLMLKKNYYIINDPTCLINAIERIKEKLFIAEGGK